MHERHLGQLDLLLPPERQPYLWRSHQLSDRLVPAPAQPHHRCAFMAAVSTAAWWPAGSTPLHCAAEGGHLQSFQVLLAKYSSAARACDSEGRSPLHLAAVANCCPIIGALAKHAQLAAVDVHGCSALDIALAQVRLLRLAG